MKLADLPARPKQPIKIYGLKSMKNIKGKNTIKDIVVYYHHIDGMYSYCTVDGPKGGICHLSVSTPLIKHEDGYKVAEEE